MAVACTLLIFKHLACCSKLSDAAEAFELAKEGRPDELTGAKLCRDALGLALLEMDSELTNVQTWLEQHHDKS